MGLSWSIRHPWCPAPVKETKLQKHILKEASTFTHYRTRTLGKNGFPEDMNTDPAKTKCHEPKTEAKLIEKQSLLSGELVPVAPSLDIHSVIQFVCLFVCLGIRLSWV